jgi:NH3-dependent NAD+ synthetase
MTYGYNTVIDTNNQTNTNLKFNVPFSLARLPDHVDKSLVNTKPEIVQRKNVHSYFKPSVADFVRENMKQGIRDQISYQTNDYCSSANSETKRRG